jgi:membrane-bound lytic murein transglycosylase C
MIRRHLNTTFNRETMVKSKKIIFFLIVLPIIYSLFLYQIGYCEDLLKESKEWEKLKRSVEETWIRNVLEIEEEWDKVEAQQRREWEELKRRINLLWGEAGMTSTKKDWVDYDKNLLARNHVDFKNGTMEIEALVPLNESDPYKKAKKLISGKVESSFMKKELEERSILANQLKTARGFYVTNKNLKNYIQSDVMAKINTIPASIIGKDGKRRLRFSARLSLVPDHVRIRAEKYREPVQVNAARFFLKPQLIMAVIHTESYFNPVARSNAGAYGLMQLIPRYAGREAYQFVFKEDRIITPRYLYQPNNNINLGSAYLHLLYNKHLADIQGKDKRLFLTICSYNWGPTAIRKKIIQRHQLSFMPSENLYRLLRTKTPKETSDYLKRVTERSNLYNNLF